MLTFMALLSFDHIQAMAQTIADNFHPEAIYLFGSYAYGKPTEDSDLDFLVVMPIVDHPVRYAANIRKHLPKSTPVDIIVRGPEEVDRRIKEQDGFISMIVEEGKLLWSHL
jgi:uncharacterized protein